MSTCQPNQQVEVIFQGAKLPAFKINLLVYHYHFHYGLIDSY